MRSQMNDILDKSFLNHNFKHTTINGLQSRFKGHLAFMFICM